MLCATLVCSDPGCASEHEACGELERLDALACDCGCALVALAFFDTEPARSGQLEHGQRLG
jgi:hypothetical protein